MLQTVSSKRGEHQCNDLTPSMIPHGEIKMGLLWKEATPEFVIHEGVEEIRTESGEAQNQGSQGEMRTLAPPQNGAVSRGKEPAGWLLACRCVAPFSRYGFGV